MALSAITGTCSERIASLRTVRDVRVHISQCGQHHKNLTNMQTFGSNVAHRRIATCGSQDIRNRGPDAAIRLDTRLNRGLLVTPRPSYHTQHLATTLQIMTLHEHPLLPGSAMKSPIRHSAMHTLQVQARLLQRSCGRRADNCSARAQNRPASNNCAGFHSSCSAKIWHVPVEGVRLFLNRSCLRMPTGLCAPILALLSVDVVHHLADCWH
jgi:hypothetical protein